MRLAIGLLLFLLELASAEAPLELTVLAGAPPAPLRGAAIHAGRLILWGGGGWGEWDLATLEPLSSPRPRALAEAACVFGNQLIANQGRRLLALPLDGRPVEVIDSDSDITGCLAASLIGHTGIIAIHRGAQIRWYEPAAGGWQARDLYSIYTPSRQAGLLLRDVDRDGRVDILAGNYWLRSPAAWDLPWRLYAINTWFEEPESAMLRTAWLRDGLLAAESRASPARFSLFTPGRNVHEMWNERPISANPPLVRVAGLVVIDLEGRGRPGFAAGEDNGVDSRVVWFSTPVARPVVLQRGSPVVCLLADAGRLITVFADRVVCWRYRRK